MDCLETTLTAADATELFIRCYLPARRPRQKQLFTRTLLIVHGLSEHGGRYEHIARQFTAADWRVIVGDHRGHGRSGGIPTHVKTFSQYTADVDQIYQHFQLRREDTALLAHSMGGLVAIRYAQTYPDRMSALMLSSPLLGVQVRIPLRTVILGRLLSWIHPLARFRSRVQPHETVHCPEALARRLADPLVHRSVTAGWYFSMQRAIRKAWEEAHRFEVPTLMLQAGDDKLVCPYASQQWFHQTRSRSKTFRLLPEHYHEVLNEPDWRDTVKQMHQWLNQVMPTASIPAVAQPRRAA